MLDFSTLSTESDRLKIAVERHAPGFSIHRKGDLYFIETPSGYERIAEGFKDPNTGRRLLLWLAGGHAPSRWSIRSWFGSSALLDCRQHAPAIIWTDPALCHFPAAEALLLPLYIGR